MNNSLVIFGSIVGLSGWIWLFIQDWKIALAVLLAMWGNNLVNKYNL